MRYCMNIITYGTFDMFHFWHLRLLERAKELANWWTLYVWISTDEFNALKWKESVIPYEERLRIVWALKCVDYVFPEVSWNQKLEDMVRWKARLVMWDDWEWKFDMLDCIYIPRTPWISSTKIKQFVKLKN